MANEVNLELDPRKFLALIQDRKTAIASAPETPLPASYPVNRLMLALHPTWQAVKISKIEAHGQDAKSFTLVPDMANGTQTLAYFCAGQYICVYLAIGGSRLLRPYSIRSAPAAALQGEYIITIKRTQDGFASEYILDTWQVGDSLRITGPEGNFTYEPLRDAPHVVGLAGGSGITPFYALACAIADGSEACSLTLLYGSRTKDDILLKDEFDAIAAKSPKVTVIHVLSDKPDNACESGFLTTELIRKYAPNGDFSVFMCGPQEMYNFCDIQLAALDLPLQRVRRELFGECKNPTAQPDYPGVKTNKFKLSVIIRGEMHEMPCVANESLLVALERAGIAAPSRCRSGECGFCHSKLFKGNVYTPAMLDKRRLADVAYNYIHPCVTFPLSDIVLEVALQNLFVEDK